MKNNILLLIVLFLTTLSFAQTKFTDGFNTGYKKGYCQDQGIGCIEPIPPIAPIPKNGESSDSYTDGYNRGFQMGLNSRESNSNERTRYKTAKPKFVDDIMYKSPTNLKIEAIKALDRKQNFNLKYAETLKAKINKLQKSDIDYLFAEGLNEILESISFYSKPVNVNLAESAFIQMDDYLNKALGIIFKNEKSYTKNNQHYILKTETDIYKGPGVEYGQIVNTRRTRYKNKTVYFTIGGYLHRVKVESEKGEWSKVSNESIDDNTYFHIKGWIRTKYILKRKTNNKPSNKKTTVNLQAIYELLQNGKYQEGIALIDKSIGSEETELLYGIRGTANYLYKNYSEAISDITKSAKKNKEILPRLLFYRALAKSEVGDFYGAIGDYDLLIEKGDAEGLNYDLATVYNNKAYSYVGLKQFEEAIPFATRALTLDKSKWYIWDTRAEIYFNTGEYRNAINDASKAIKIQENANTFYIRGLAHIKLNEKALGCKDLSRAGELGKSEAYEKIKKYCN